MPDPPRRVSFFTGRLLTAEDLQAEQEYHRTMRYLHNRMHGYGIADGLDVRVDGAGIHVGPGLAVDPLGRELVVTEPRCLASDPVASRAWTHLVLTWAEVPEGLSPGTGGDPVALYLAEVPALGLVAPDTAPRDAVPLARLRRRWRGRLVCDRSIRRPIGTT